MPGEKGVDEKFWYRYCRGDDVDARVIDAEEKVESQWGKGDRDEQALRETLQRNIIFKSRGAW